MAANLASSTGKIPRLFVRVSACPSRGGGFWPISSGFSVPGATFTSIGNNFGKWSFHIIGTEGYQGLICLLSIRQRRAGRASIAPFAMCAAKSPHRTALTQTHSPAAGGWRIHRGLCDVCGETTAPNRARPKAIIRRRGIRPGQSFGPTLGRGFRSGETVLLWQVKRKAFLQGRKGRIQKPEVRRQRIERLSHRVIG